MSITFQEAEYEEYMEQLYEEHKKEAIQQFTGDRLRSYYLDNPLVAGPAMEALSKARTVLVSDTTAAFVLAAIAIEVGLKTTLLKPIIYGLVHGETVAGLITDLTMSLRGDKYEKLIMRILQDQGGVDLLSCKRSGVNKPLWEEITKVRKKRNVIMHKAESASKKDAELALGVASEILTVIFPSVMEKMGFHIHDNHEICNNWQCSRVAKRVTENRTPRQV